MTTLNDSIFSVSLPLYGVLGGLLVLLAEVGLFLKIELIGLYCTPLAWTGYILLTDALLWNHQKYSYIRSRPKDFLRMLAWSVICWSVFEWFNVYLENWVYWIFIDAISLYLYMAQGLVVTAGLFVIYMGMAALGLRSWVQTRREQSAAHAA